MLNRIIQHYTACFETVFWGSEEHRIRMFLSVSNSSMLLWGACWQAIALMWTQGYDKLAPFNLHMDMTPSLPLSPLHVYHMYHNCWATTPRWLVERTSEAGIVVCHLSQIKGLRLHVSSMWNRGQLLVRNSMFTRPTRSLAAESCWAP